MSNQTAMENGKDEAAFRRVVENYLQDFHLRHPTLALCSGLHDWDGCLEDLSRDALVEEARAVRGFMSELSAINPDGLQLPERLDLRILLNNAQARLHEIEVIRAWEKNPQIYGDTLATGMLNLALFDQCSDSDKCDAITSKLKQTPRLIESARQNIKNPAPIFVEHGITSISGALRLVEESVPRLFRGTGSESSQSDLLSAVDGASRSLRDFLSYLRSNLAAKATCRHTLGTAADG